MPTVYVLNKDGKPLMPTTRGGHVRHLLKEQKARVVRAKPFTIQLLYETDGRVRLCAHLQTRVDVLFLPKIKIKRDKNLAHLCESDIITLIR